MQKTTIALMLLALMVFTISCQPNVSPLPNPDVSDSSEPMEPVTPEEEDEWIEAEAVMVESVDAQVMESWPLQVNVVVKGFLPDGCTSIHESSAQRYSQRFQITFVTRRPKDAFCTEALEPFDVVIPLEVSGLKAGTYLVDAYGTQSQFIFEQDNILPKPSS